jgi:hypothetical protein
MEVKQFLLPDKHAQPPEEDVAFQKETGVIPLWGIVFVLSFLVQCTLFVWKGPIVTLQHVFGAATGHMSLTLLGAAVPLWYNDNPHARPLIIVITWAMVTVSLMVAGWLTE